LQPLRKIIARLERATKFTQRDGKYRLNIYLLWFFTSSGHLSDEVSKRAGDCGDDANAAREIAAVARCRGKELVLRGMAVGESARYPAKVGYGLGFYQSGEETVKLFFGA
jgi:hypothetical protein